MTNRTRTLYVGVTSDLERRVMQHKHKLIRGFTSRYNISMLVWYQDFDDVIQAIEAEKRIKGWRREKKTALIEEMNREWKNLAADSDADEQVPPKDSDDSSEACARTPRPTSG